LLIVSLGVGAFAAAEAPQSANVPSFGQWLDGAVSSVETWTKDSGELEVHGQAVRTVAPDTVAIQIGASIERESEKDAQAEANRIINEVIEALKALGVPEKQIATSGYSIYRVYDYRAETTVPKGFNVTVTLRVTVSDFGLIGQILDAAVERGANSVGDLRFSYSKEEALYQEALRDAIQAAKAKAENMADAAEVTLRTLLELRETSRTAPSPYAVASYAKMDAVAGSGTQIMAGEIEITADVALVYQIK